MSVVGRIQSGIDLETRPGHPSANRVMITFLPPRIDDCRSDSSGRIDRSDVFQTVCRLTPPSGPNRHWNLRQKEVLHTRSNLGSIIQPVVFDVLASGDRSDDAPAQSPVANPQGVNIEGEGRNRANRDSAAGDSREATRHIGEQSSLTRSEFLKVDRRIELRAALVNRADADTVHGGPLRARAEG